MVELAPQRDDPASIAYSIRLAQDGRVHFGDSGLQFRIGFSAQLTCSQQVRQSLRWLTLLEQEVPEITSRRR